MINGPSACCEKQFTRAMAPRNRESDKRIRRMPWSIEKRNPRVVSDAEPPFSRVIDDRLQILGSMEVLFLQSRAEQICPAASLPQRLYVHVYATVFSNWWLSSNNNRALAIKKAKLRDSVCDATFGVQVHDAEAFR